MDEAQVYGTSSWSVGKGRSEVFHVEHGRTVTCHWQGVLLCFHFLFVPCKKPYLPSKVSMRWGRHRYSLAGKSDKIGKRGEELHIRRTSKNNMQ